jgi:hypothetical protein
LSGLPGHAAFHFRFLRLPWRRSRILVFQTPSRCLAIIGRSRVSRSSQHRGGMLLAQESPLRADLTVDMASIIFRDNVSAVYLSDNPVHHKRTKHVELDIHFVRERTTLGQLRVLHVTTKLQSADIMTKGLPAPLFTEFRGGLCVNLVTLRENCNSPSAWNFPESQKSGTRGRQSSPSVALGEELHSGKMAFPECLKGHGTRGRPALGEGHLPREQHSGKTAHEKEKVHLTAALDGAV